MQRLIITVLMAGWVIVSTLSFSKMACAQEAAKDQRSAEAAKPVKPNSLYRIEFVVRELEDGKRLNSRSYTMSVQDGEWRFIRVGNRIPYNTGKDQFQYFDVGVNIDCHPRERENYIVLETKIDISSVVKDESTSAGTLNPVVRQARSNSDTAITLGKPTVITSMDDVSSNRRYEVEVTATKVK